MSILRSRITYKKKFSGKKRKTGRKKRVNNKKHSKKNRERRGGGEEAKVTRYEYKIGDKVLFNGKKYEIAHITPGLYGGPKHIFIKEDMFETSEQYKTYANDLHEYDAEEIINEQNHDLYPAFVNRNKPPNIEEYKKEYKNSMELKLKEVKPDDLILYMFNTTEENP